MYTSYDLYMDLGELALTKVAGELDNDAFDYYAVALVKQAAKTDPSVSVPKYTQGAISKYDEAATTKNKADAEAAAKKLSNRAKAFASKAGKGVGNALSLKQLREGLLHTYDLGGSRRIGWGNVGKGAAKSLGAYGALGAVGFGAHKALKKNK